MIFGLSSLKTLKLPISEMADGVSKELGSDSISFGDKNIQKWGPNFKLR